MLPACDETLPDTDGRLRAAGSPAPRPYLFLLLECARPHAAGARFSLADTDAVTLGRGSERGWLRQAEGAGLRRLTLRVPDPWMSSSHAHLTRVLGRFVLEDAGSKNGTMVNGTRIEQAALEDGDLCELGHSFFLYREAVAVARDEPSEVDAASLHPAAFGLATLSTSLAWQFEQLRQVAVSKVAVVVRGESGTGKELCARAVHQMSGRRAQPADVDRKRSQGDR